jgi:hypothetical protein
MGWARRLRSRIRSAKVGRNASSRLPPEAWTTIPSGRPISSSWETAPPWNE